MKSMTGFGAATARIPAAHGGGALTAEIRSVNHRFLDLKVSLPVVSAKLEEEVREAVRQRVERGRVDVRVTKGAHRTRPRIEIDTELARAYLDAWRTLERKLGVEAPIDLGWIHSRPEVIRRVEIDVPEDVERQVALRAVGSALERFERSRRREGANLARELGGRIRKLEQIARGMRARAKVALPEAKRRLEARLRELDLARVEPERIATEAAFQVERGDVTEETVRLASHLEGLRGLVGSKDAVGRPFDFLLQEVQREVNTIASKSADLELTRLAVDAKGEIEKLREQIQNVE